MPGDATYTGSTTGGIADPSQSTLSSFNTSFAGSIPITSTGAACGGASPCAATVRGMVGGNDSGARIVFSFVLASGTVPKTLRGAAVLKAP